MSRESPCIEKSEAHRCSKRRQNEISMKFYILYYSCVDCIYILQEVVLKYECAIPNIKNSEVGSLRFEPSSEFLLYIALHCRIEKFLEFSK